MRSVAGLMENATSPLHPDDGPGFLMEHSDRETLRYQHVLNDSTEYELHRARGIYREQIENIVFSGFVSLEAGDVTPDFFSVNKSTSDTSTPSRLEKELDQLCLAALDENFETGVESRFSKGLQRLYKHNPIMVLQLLQMKLMDNDINPEVLAEILQWASRPEAGDLRSRHLNLLSRGLDHLSPLVRDSAALALAYLDEEAAIVHLQTAIAKEEVTELRQDLEDLLHSLES